MGGGGGHGPPAGPEPWYASKLANKSGLCPPDFHYARETWYPHGGFYPDPKGWRQATALTLLGMGFVFYWAFDYSNKHEVWDRPPKVWIPQLLWNPRIPDPVDFRGRKLDRYTGKPVEGEEAAAEH